MSNRLSPAFVAIAALAGCSGPPPTADNAAAGGSIGSMGAPATPAVPNQTLPADVPAGNATTPTQTMKVEADFVGKWIGPEGLVLDVEPKAGGGLAIVNQWTLDDKGAFTAEVTEAGLRFTRNGLVVVAKPSNGDATGMKWLAGKQDCLTVTVGAEGYCRS